MIRKTMAVAFASVVLAGCNISGKAEKGPFLSGSTVTATPLNADATLNTSQSIQSAINSNQGYFRIDSNSFRRSTWLNVEASGLHFNEYTGETSEEVLSLNAINRASRRSNQVNINLYTHLVAARFTQRVADGQRLSRAYSNAERDLRNLFNLNRRVTSTRLSITDGRSRLRSFNANLALFSGGFAAAGGNAVMLDNLTQDFADDGLINGVGEATFSAIAIASAEDGLIETIRANLIVNGATNPPDASDLGELPEWVDTEGGTTENTAPVAVSGEATLDEDTSLDITLVATDADGDALTYEAEVNNGSLSINGNVATYTPDANYNGESTLAFTASDGTLDSNFGVVSITVNPVDDAPTASDLNAGSVAAGSSIVVILQGADIDGDAITYSVTDGSLGTVTLDSDGIGAVYTANTGVSGEDSFTYTVSANGVDTEATVTVNVVLPDSSISGRITQPDGAVIPNVTVEALDSEGMSVATTTSGVDGTYTITSDIGTDVVLTFRATGFADQVIPAKTPDTQDQTASLNVTMMMRGASETFNTDRAGAVEGTDGAAVAIEPGDFIDAQGVEVVGDIQLTITPVDVSNQAELGAFPGDFAGIVEATGEESPIATLGTVEYTFTQNGEEIRVADGQTVDIVIPIYDTVNPQTGNDIYVGEEIALWSLNEETGIWLQEGNGEVVSSPNSPTGFGLLAQVSHFTWWNCDVTVNPGKVTVTVNGSDLGTARIHARTDGNIGGRPSQVDTLVTIGETSNSLYIASNATTCLWVEYSFVAGTTSTTPEQCITNVTPGGLYDLTFDIFSSDPLAIGNTNLNTAYKLNEVVAPIVIVPYSVESEVDYVITAGELPAGMSLVAIDTKSAQIQGTPTEQGHFSVTIQGTDADDNTDETLVSFDVVDLLPPELEGDFNGELGTAVEIIVPYGANTVTRDLSVYNIGDPATSWSVEYLWDEGEIPEGAATFTSSGVLTLSPNLFIDGYIPELAVTASNAAGSSNTLELWVYTDFEIEIPVDICIDEVCDEFGNPIPQ